MESPVGPEELLSRAQQGDADDLTVLLEQVGSKISQAIEAKIPKYLRSVLSAEDIMSLTYPHAFDVISGCRARTFESFRGWIYTVAINNLISTIKSIMRGKRPDPRRRLTYSPANESFVDPLERLAGTCTRPSQAARRTENAELLRAALTTLPPDQRLVVELYDLQGVPMDEVALRLGKRPGTVHAMRVGAHRALRMRLGSSSDYLSS
jgi:RNA polymerase sigma factor (sigma-70 family)